VSKLNTVRHGQHSSQFTAKIIFGFCLAVF
jgi:hypothetical protein